MNPSSQRGGSCHSGELVARLFETPGSGQIGVSLPVDLGGSKEHDIDPSPSGVVEEVGNRYLSRAAREILEVLGAGAKRRNLRIDGTNARQPSDVRRVRTETLAGGGAEFASGAEGLGSGSTGSSAIVFEEDSFGSKCKTQVRTDERGKR